MNYLDKTIAFFAPGWGRTRYASRIAVNALYEAGEPSRTRRPKAKRGSGDVSVARAGSNLRDLGRYFDENLDIAKGALDTLEANIVGNGVRPEPGVMDRAGKPADEINDQISALWKHWAKRPDVTGEYDLTHYQRLLVRSTMRDGELFTRTLTGNIAGLSRGGVGVPFWLEAMESDFVDINNNDERLGILQGIQRGKWGEASIFHAAKKHPAGLEYSTGNIAIPASQMIHTKLTSRFGQVRGVSVFASVINRLDDIKEIDESERVAARVAAAMAAYVKKGTPDMYIAPDIGEDERHLEWAPGQIFELEVGEDAGVIDSNRPNNALIPFRDSQLRSAAGGLNVSYSSLSKNYNGTYSSQRQELVEQYGAYGVLWSYFARHTFQRIYERFIDAAVQAKMLNIADADPLTLYDCQHSRPPLVWIDPVKESKANEIVRANNWKSDGQIIRDRGDDPRETYRQIARDVQDKENAGIKPDPEPTPAPGPAEPEPKKDK